MKQTKGACLVFGLTLLITLNSCTWWGQKKEAVSFVLVNVLDEKYFEDCRIIEIDSEILSINVPMEELESYALDPRNGWNKDTTQIVLYCGNYKCTASGESANMLKTLGFKYVWAYEGGTAEWKQRGFPVGGPCQSGFLNDYEMPEGYSPDAETPIITADQLKKKMEKFTSQ